MEMGIIEDGIFELRKVFNPIVLKTEDGQKLSICMRDDGFEIKSNGANLYYAVNGTISEIDSKISNEDRAKLAFEIWASNKGMTIDQVFLSTEGIPKNPYEDPDTKFAYEIWMASRV